MDDILRQIHRHTEAPTYRVWKQAWMNETQRYVYNGIAYRDSDASLWVTGKEWPEIFALALVEAAPPAEVGRFCLDARRTRPSAPSAPSAPAARALPQLGDDRGAEPLHADEPKDEEQ